MPLVGPLMSDAADLAEILRDLAGAIGSLATFAPNDYPEWSYQSYSSGAEDVKELWPRIRARLRVDIEAAAFIDKTLEKAFAAFDAGDKEEGRAAMWSIYNLNLQKLR